MRHRNKVATALVAALATAALAACGSSDSGKNDTVSGQFEVVSGAPADYQSLAGEASLERADGGTTASLKLTGLEPKAAYVAHLHSEGCEQPGPGGPHFKFDPAGSDEPPNEIQLEFSADPAGSAEAKASSPREVPLGEAGSIVLHEASGDDQMTAAATRGGGEAVLVHEGHDHSEADGGSHGADAPPTPIACAQLEGGKDGEGAIATVVVRNGEPVGGIQQLEYSAGEEIRFQVESDVADEVHVHGYDLMEDVPAGGAASFDFPAELEGIFEVELEGRKEQIAELRVNP
ncbi:MAG TPA: hypothetical protein VGO36_00210 [Solirubrobacterales bacterium]|jgi:Cu-Zn family superoxide dismutase|nr:hypothetical protein [Solirubrobacterales bacterium]